MSTQTKHSIEVMDTYINSFQPIEQMLHDFNYLIWIDSIMPCFFNCEPYGLACTNKWMNTQTINLIIHL